MTIEQGRSVGIDRFPNFHKSGSVRGMKRLYYGKDCCWYVVAATSTMFPLN